VSNATRWYTSREATKAAVRIDGAQINALVDAKVEAASEDIERLLGRRFIPYTATKQYRWPSTRNRNAYCLELDEDLIAVTALTKATDDATAIAAADYFLEPVNTGPPYDRIEIDLSSSEYFTWEDTPQRAVRVTGRWGYGEDTKAAGVLENAITDAAATTLDVLDASKVNVGDTLKIDSEQLFVSERSTFDTTADLNDTLTAGVNDVTVTVTDGTKVKQGEVILIDSEKMLVESITGNNLTVQRAYDKSVLAAHSGAGVNVYAYRTLTVVRGINGTTAATHLDAAAITKFAPPADIVELCTAEAVAKLQQDRSGWTGQMGGGEGNVNVQPLDVSELRKQIMAKYRRWVFA
jgi:hypothetical protein